MSKLIPRDPDWEVRCRASFSRQGFMRLIDAEIVAMEPGDCTVAAAAKPELCPQRGFLHGGVTARQDGERASIARMPATLICLGPGGGSAGCFRAMIAAIEEALP